MNSRSWRVRMRLKKGPPDFVLFITVMGLLGIGLIMVFSSSAVTSYVDYHDRYYFFKRQLLWALISLAFLVVVMKVNYTRLKDFAVPVMIVAIVCLVLVKIGLGVGAKGSVRWLGFGSFRLFAPSELVKLAICLFMAKTLEIHLDKIKSFTRGMVPFLAIMAVVCGLILAQPDLGTSFVVAATIFFMLIVAGARWSHLIGIGSVGLATVWTVAMAAHYRADRIMAWFDPFKYAKKEGYQTVQSLYALGSGGLFGMGLGLSRQKFFYLPEQHTDFIFAILGEELGFIGIALVISLFLLFVWRGFRIAVKAPDTFGTLLAAGLTAAIAFQAAVNIGVVCGALPVTGITLPFISYGGSSLLFTMSEVGLLLNISRYCE